MDIGTTIIQTAKQYIGFPYEHHGRTRYGLDCLGLILIVGKTLDILPANYIDPPYSRSPDSDLLIKGFNQHLTLVQAPKTGDVLLLNIGKSPKHLAFFEEGETMNYMIHAQASPSGGKVERHVFDELKWGPRLYGVYRFNKKSASAHVDADIC